MYIVVVTGYSSYWYDWLQNRPIRFGLGLEIGLVRIRVRVGYRVRLGLVSIRFRVRLK